MSLPKEKNLLNNARRLRKNMTRQERHLWYDFLRNYPVKIYKQKIIAGYIIDFYCDSAMLAIEIDGEQHKNDEIFEYDNQRTKYLASYGIEVIRFSNKDIDENFEAVCKVIKRKIEGI